ncbi:MAG: PIN domain-containing protein [Acidobacteria bacterium]|nr:PIN domain-containing protein [Acidobacteriota bacterium]
MMLLDTNVLIYASQSRASHHEWARSTVAQAVSTEGAAVNAVCLAEICVGERDPAAAAARIRGWGVQVLDVPVAAAEACAAAYRLYRERRRQQSGGDSPLTPMPDFFIGAHAQVMGWTLATADTARFKTCFPAVRLVTP